MKNFKLNIKWQNQFQGVSARWILQCFPGIHLELAGQKQIVNVTEERHLILKYLHPECRKYYHLIKKIGLTAEKRNNSSIFT